MKNAAFAIAASIGVHAILAVAIAVLIANAPSPETLASLDLSSVELSFSEKDDAPQAVAPPPSPPAEPPPRPEAARPEPPPAEAIPLPPDPDSMDVKAPGSEVKPMERVEATGEVEPEREPPVQEVSAAAPVEAARQARIDAPPRPKKAIRPYYPEGARRRGEQGNVVLEIRVDESGSVGDVKIVTSSGFGELDAAAVHAVRAARFAPAKSGRDYVASTARLTLTFRLRN